MAAISAASIESPLSSDAESRSCPMPASRKARRVRGGATSRSGSSSRICWRTAPANAAALNCRRRNRSCSLLQSSARLSIYDFVSGWLDDPSNSRHHAFELADFGGQLLLPGGGQVVIPRAPVIFRLAPLGQDPSFNQHALQRWVERPFFHLQDIFRLLLDVLRDAIAMHRPQSRQAFEDQHV